ncbi:hypothetical protein AAFF_G00057110 [Aldrovandia affinis]|uniref:Uncharacterized protein n=1 Tax=Aldrovandia affinis TaxID=143900 RepID=A0AAD7S0K0_9TELE|nr:hypothetical protein AAFF_G00057110 [Aldrovandia affinis]
MALGRRGEMVSVSSSRTSNGMGRLDVFDSSIPVPGQVPRGAMGSDTQPRGETVTEAVDFTVARRAGVRLDQRKPGPVSNVRGVSGRLLLGTESSALSVREKGAFRSAAHGLSL